jgi:hypothetical protein
MFGIMADVDRLFLFFIRVPEAATFEELPASLSIQRSDSLPLGSRSPKDVLSRSVSALPMD